MEEATQRSSLFSSATVVAAIISGVTAVVTALLPWILSSETKPETPVVAPTQSQAVTPLQSLPPLTLQLPATAAPKPNLTMGVWTIVNSVDDAGTTWEGSTLKFTAQQETPEGLALTGFFEWRENRINVAGREYFVAQYDANSRQVFIEGKYVESPTNQLAIGSFAAQLSADGRQLLNGTWGNTPGNQEGVLGGWEARR